ncbi:MAG: TIGR03557 family F420-dependent LLM class oxidoreductase [Actinobacteria bacterium]|nr:TIGR03557 family F420-dependent LLM class oxidoreductase [Actinomycetota bacterium]MBV8958693.1 TIGR03557 family F420-dependent LLM class oxidoreductase [Actinomycetota bacterium]
MTEIGIFLSSEEHGPNDLVRMAQQAESEGFRSVAVSDHFHPWIDRQGESPFVWNVIGGIASTTQLRITTAVTCPTMRTHPAVIAQAAATSAVMAPGRFRLGVGTGENLNEHILGDRWPAADERMEMLEEAVEVMRELWKGKITDHEGKHYKVVNARIYSLPDEAPPVLVSGFGPKATSMAARIGDGYVSTAPEPDLPNQYSQEGGRGPKVALMKVCWDEDEAKARKTAFELWPSTGVPGELSQELPMPGHFEQASEKVTEDDVAEKIVCGPDPQRHLEMINKYIAAGYDEIYVGQVGPETAGMVDFYHREILPKVA